MGVVYRATHPLIGKQVAIKVLRAEFVSQQQVERLIIEARAVNEIQHPGIIDIFGFGVLPDGRPYVVMELLQGESLSSFIRRKGRLDVATTLWVLEQMLTALGAAHRAGIVHRDLKPGNVFLSRASDGTYSVKLVDFGIAKLVRSSEGPTTVEGSILGTPEFMAPEQIRGTGLGPATDLYAVGVMLYQMLTGALPFQGEPMQILFAHIEQPPPAPSSLAPSTPPGLDALVLRLMAKEPGLRPESAEAVRQVLRQGLETWGAPYSTRPMAPVPPQGSAERELETVRGRRLSPPRRSLHKGYWLAGGLLLVSLSGVAAYHLRAVPPVVAVPPPSPSVASTPVPTALAPPLEVERPADVSPTTPEPSVQEEQEALPVQQEVVRELEPVVASEDLPSETPTGTPASVKPRTSPRPKSASAAASLSPPDSAEESTALTLEEALEVLSARRRAKGVPPDPSPPATAATLVVEQGAAPVQTAQREAKTPPPPPVTVDKSPDTQVLRASSLPRSNVAPPDAMLMERVYELDARYRRHRSPPAGFEASLKELHAQALEATSRSKVIVVNTRLSRLSKTLEAPPVVVTTPAASPSAAPSPSLPPPALARSNKSLEASPGAVAPPAARPPAAPSQPPPIGLRLRAMLSTPASTPSDARLTLRFEQLKALYLQRSALHAYPVSIPERLLELHASSLTADTATQRMDIQRGLDAWRQALDVATPK
ncbi:protein kinase domain-containing protein [Myxococcus fulvus]|uniref:serine/threonine-protein kinase n=1 Tax=Myxococcus fulvus TaxID=33 RepID=UPI003B99B711